MYGPRRLMNASRGPGPGSWVNRDVIQSPVTMEIAVNDVIAVSAWPSFACVGRTRVWPAAAAAVAAATLSPRTRPRPACRAHDPGVGRTTTKEHGYGPTDGEVTGDRGDSVRG